MSSDAAGPEATQRREAVRVQCAIAVHVGAPGERMIRCSGVDLSGNGVRARVPGLELGEGDEVDVYLRMPDGVEVEARASVVRRVDPMVYAFQFSDITPYLRDLLIRHVFAVQRSALQARSARA